MILETNCACRMHNHPFNNRFSRFLQMRLSSTPSQALRDKCCRQSWNTGIPSVGVKILHMGTNLGLRCFCPMMQMPQTWCCPWLGFPQGCPPCWSDLQCCCFCCCCHCQRQVPLMMFESPSAAKKSLGANKCQYRSVLKGLPFFGIRGPCCLASYLFWSILLGA